MPFNKGQDLQVEIGFICSKFQPALTTDGKVDIRARIGINRVRATRGKGVGVEALQTITLFNFGFDDMGNKKSVNL